MERSVNGEESEGGRAKGGHRFRSGGRRGSGDRGRGPPPVQRRARPHHAPRRSHRDAGRPLRPTRPGRRSAGGRGGTVTRSAEWPAARRSDAGSRTTDHAMPVIQARAHFAARGAANQTRTHKTDPAPIHFAVAEPVNRTTAARHPRSCSLFRSPPPEGRRLTGSQRTRHARSPLSALRSPLSALRSGPSRVLRKPVNVCAVSATGARVLQ
jgi:hypothetical protein